MWSVPDLTQMLGPVETEHRDSSAWSLGLGVEGRLEQSFYGDKVKMVLRWVLRTHSCLLCGEGKKKHSWHRNSRFKDEEA